MKFLRSDNDGIRICVAKFLEALVLFHSLRSRTSENIPGLDVSLDRVPSTHPFLKASIASAIFSANGQIEEMQAAGEIFLSDLIALFNEPTVSGGLLTMAAASLVTIARMVHLALPVG